MTTEKYLTVGGWRWITAFALGYFVLAAAALTFSQQSSGMALLWPASGVAVGAILLIDRRFYSRMIAALAIASMAVNLWYSVPAGVAAMFTLANIAEAMIAGRIACGGRPYHGSFAAPYWVARFAFGALIATATGAAIASTTVLLADQTDAAAFARSWFATTLLGLLLMTPVVITMVRALRRPSPSDDARPNWCVALVYALCGVTAVFAFALPGQPVLFLPMATAVFATYVLGVSGAVTSVSIIAILGTYVIASGTGPFGIFRDTQIQILYFQGYLVVLLASVLPMASVLERRRAAMRLLTHNIDLLETAERTAHVGHWRSEAGADTVFWSDEVFRIHGLEPTGKPVTLAAAVDAYHPTDRPAVMLALRTAADHNQPFSFESRIVRPDGSVRIVRSTGRPEVNEWGDQIATFGIIHDVTKQVEALAQLEREKAKAQQAAQISARLAETDQLTGIANRRKLIQTLATSVKTARKQDEPLSFIMLDADDFKAINDTLGHAAGDRVLRGIATVISTTVRPNDLVGRLGGEEFGVILAATDNAEAAMIAERIRSKVADLAFSGGEITASISLGISTLTQGEGASALMQRADRALYDAKARGKNRVVRAAA